VISVASDSLVETCAATVETRLLWEIREDSIVKSPCGKAVVVDRDLIESVREKYGRRQAL
jgi:hypothetical protein